MGSQLGLSAESCVWARWPGENIRLVAICEPRGSSVSGEVLMLGDDAAAQSENVRFP